LSFRFLWQDGEDTKRALFSSISRHDVLSGARFSAEFLKLQEIVPVMKKIMIALLLPLGALAQGVGEFKIKGDLKLSRPVEKVYFQYRTADKSVIDSLVPKDGEYKFEGQVPEPMMAMITVRYAAPVEKKPIRENFSFFIEPGKIELKSKDSLSATEVKGSKSNVDFEMIKKKTEEYSKRMQPLFAVYNEASAKNDRALMEKTEAELDAIDAEMREAVYADFLKRNSTSPVALYALKQYAGWDLDPAKIGPMFAQLPASTREWPSAKAFGEQIEVAKKTAVGSYAIEFSQADTLGQQVALSSFRGKYVLVDFWASWCGPCRKENPNVVKAFNDYRNKNFTVLGVSLDRPDAKDKWLAAIHKDNLTWTHVSDLQYWDNAVAKLYGIRAIPQNLLLDPSGKIIAKNIRGAELTKTLDKLLK